MKTQSKIISTLNDFINSTKNSIFQSQSDRFIISIISLPSKDIKLHDKIDRPKGFKSPKQIKARKYIFIIKCIPIYDTS